MSAMQHKQSKSSFTEYLKHLETIKFTSVMELESLKAKKGILVLKYLREEQDSAASTNFKNKLGSGRSATEDIGIGLMSKPGVSTKFLRVVVLAR